MGRNVANTRQEFHDTDDNRLGMTINGRGSAASKTGCNPIEPAASSAAFFMPEFIARSFRSSNHSTDKAHMAISMYLSGTTCACSSCFRSEYCGAQA